MKLGAFNTGFLRFRLQLAQEVSVGFPPFQLPDGRFQPPPLPLREDTQAANGARVYVRGRHRDPALAFRAFNDIADGVNPAIYQFIESTGGEGLELIALLLPPGH